MLGWWNELPWQLRAGVAVLLLLASTVLLLIGYVWIWGWVVGAILLPFSFPNDAQRRGYHDF